MEEIFQQALYDKPKPNGVEFGWDTANFTHICKRTIQSRRPHLKLFAKSLYVIIYHVEM